MIHVVGKDIKVCIRPPDSLRFFLHGKDILVIVMLVGILKIHKYWRTFCKHICPCILKKHLFFYPPMLHLLSGDKSAVPLKLFVIPAETAYQHEVFLLLMRQSVPFLSACRIAHFQKQTVFYFLFISVHLSASHSHAHRIFCCLFHSFQHRLSRLLFLILRLPAPPAGCSLLSCASRSLGFLLLICCLL